MVVRFKARSSAPGSVRLASGAMDNLLSVADVKEGVDRGDGGIGTLVPSSEVITLDVPVLSMADLGNGTGATATISGATAGTTNAVYAAVWPFSNFVLKGSRTGNGAVALSMAVGPYLAFVLSSYETARELSNHVFFRVTDTSESVLVRILESVRDTIRGLSLVGVNSTSVVYQKFPWDRTTVKPGVLIYPDRETIQPATNASDQLDYPVNVVYIRASNQDLTDEMSATGKRRQQIRRAFEPSPSFRPDVLSDVAEAVSVRVEMGAPYDLTSFQNQYDVSHIRVIVICRESGGIA